MTLSFEIGTFRGAPLNCNRYREIEKKLELAVTKNFSLKS
jgi:hypothetical protein